MSRGFTLVELMIVILIVGIIAAIAIPNLIEARKGGNESAPIGALKTISAAQSLFRESDKEEDGNLDYGTLAELAAAGTTGLIDSVLGSGTKHGYLYAASYGASTSEFIWFATARPAIPGTTGDRYFCANHEGVTFWTVSQAFRLNSADCTQPGGVLPVGR
jgi:prepilin-type N-terminal cleavage/methylation domain-containing protein